MIKDLNKKIKSKNQEDIEKNGQKVKNKKIENENENETTEEVKRDSKLFTKVRFTTKNGQEVQFYKKNK